MSTSIEDPDPGNEAHPHPLTLRRTLPVAMGLLLLLVTCCGASGDQGTSVEAGASAIKALSPTPTAGRPSSGEPVTGLPELVEAVRSSVINVEVTARAEAPFALPFPGGEVTEGPHEENPLERFFGPERGSEREEEKPGVRPSPEFFRRGFGSGFIISPDGKALTNNHVVEGAERIRVKLEDGRTFEAQVLGRDPLTDVALIKLEGKPGDLPVAKLGDSDALKVGEAVVAIGNPFGLPSSVSAGIISARARNIGAGPYDDFLQTDAAINPGNSGGPLFNMRGEVVGINAAIVGGGSGVGFAVPSSAVKVLLPQLEKSGSVTRGWLGVAVQDVTPELARALKVPVIRGAVIADLMEESPARTSGLEPDDVVVEIDGEEISNAGELTRTVAMKPPGTVASFALYRDGARRERKVKLGKRPDLEGFGQQQQRKPLEKADERKLGMVIRDVPPELAALQEVPPGVLIAEVKPGSVADRAELAPGMLVSEAGGKPVRTALELSRILRTAKRGEVLLLRVQMGEGKALRALTVP